MIDLDPKRWLRVEELFTRASELEVEVRAAYLDEACRGDTELRDYVLDLLRADPSFDATIEKTIANTAFRVFAADDPDADEMRGEMIGPYRVERLLGSGGMGMVYLAKRADEQFDQQVAIKLGRHRLVDPDTVLRLRNERQILADLDHPNIARLFDGGTTDDGVPYLVMEYIDGIRVDTYCDVHRLDLRQRLEIFRTICSAVHYAHQNLVIHRDIKATNILVAADGTPKLLDFGIAKLIDSAGDVTDGLTREGAVIMTPTNAAPEQLLGSAVTTATDVYALGLLLYRLLSGHPAFETDGLTPTEFARAVCQQDVVRPSLRVQQAQRSLSRNLDAAGSGALEALAGDRRTNVSRLQRQLRGDLDTIILKTLRKEPERRYRSVIALADDIGLHLKSLPIVARSESWRYRAGKFVRRHYAAVTASILVVAMLAAFSVVVSVQNRKIAEERDTAREVSRFLEDIFMAQDPSEAMGAKVTADELLATGAERIKATLDERPEIQSTLMGTIGRVYRNLGEIPSSAEMLEMALTRQTELYGPDHPIVAATKDDLAQTLTQSAEYSRARALLESAVLINTREYGEISNEVAENLRNLANLHNRSGDLDRAQSTIERSIAILVQLDADAGPEPDDEVRIKLAASKATLARILQVKGDLDQTEALLIEAIDIVEKTKGENYPARAYYLQNLGVLQRTKGDLDAARETLDDAVIAIRQVLGSKHDLLAATLLQQGVVYQLTGDFENAEIVLQEALALRSERRGGSHPSVGYALVLLGILQHDKADLEAAEESLRRSLSIFESAYEGDHQNTASALTELGAVLNSAGRPDEALILLERALRIRQDDFADDHELVVGTQTEIADAFTRQGRYDEAEPILLRSYAVLEDTQGRRQRRAARALARFYELSGRAGTAPGEN
ncbi:MAG: tetratricopeptide repeat protein [Chromatiales bacterium]|nr:MAG: tetratricopeptide repeat protein [Chromatiales bacterium]